MFQLIYINDTTFFSISNAANLLEDQQHNQIQICFIHLSKNPQILYIPYSL